MKSYQVVERFFSESRVVVTLSDRVKANTIAIELHKAYGKNGLSHFFMVREITTED